MERILVVFALCFLLVSTTDTWAQDIVSKEHDENSHKPVDKPKSNEEEFTYSNRYQSQSETEKKVNERIDQYCLAMANENWKTVYDMMTKAYRDVVPFSKFLGQKRLTLQKTLIKEVKLKEDRCALAQGYYWGEQGGSGLNSLRIPLRIYLTLEEDEWRIFKNPYENSMGITLPRARKFKIPCDF